MIEINWKPSGKDLRFFAGGVTILAGMLFALGSLAWNWTALPLGIVTAVAVGMIFVGVLRPHWLRPIYLAWMVAVFPLGWTVSHAVLAVVYFAVFLPIGLMLRARGFDPLQTRPKAENESYWVERKPAVLPERYFRQY